MSYTFEKQLVAVIGATGQIGTPLATNLLSLGHDVRVLTRNATTAKVAELEALGASTEEVADMMDLDTMVAALKDADVLVCAVAANAHTVDECEPLWLDAAVKAGVKRFVPSEFGAHTMSISFGDGILFDAKKRFHEKLFASGIGWTLFYNGGIFDYFLPNLRYWDVITTFGDIDIKLFTHEIKDIGAVAAMALTDARTLNRCVQMDFNVITQREAVAQIKANFPEHEFEFKHWSSEFIADARLNANDEITAKKGAETDRERWGINYVCYVVGKLGSFEDTERCSKLYPAFQCAATPDDALKDPNFVFDKKVHGLHGSTP